MYPKCVLIQMQHCLDTLVLFRHLVNLAMADVMLSFKKEILCGLFLNFVSSVVCRETEELIIFFYNAVMIVALCTIWEM